MREWLKTMMSKKNHDAESLANKIGVNKRSVFFWLTGGVVSPENRRKLAAALGNKAIDRLSDEDKCAAEQIRKSA